MQQLIGIFVRFFFSFSDIYAKDKSSTLPSIKFVELNLYLPIFCFCFLQDKACSDGVVLRRISLSVFL